MFSASAVVPALASQWHMSAGAAAWLTAPVQAGFVAGAIVSAVSGLADRIRPHLLVAGCAAGAAACTLIMALFADGPLAAMPLRFATGAFLAGVYPVGMKLMVSWSPPASRPGAGHGGAHRIPDPGLCPAAPDRWPVAAELARSSSRPRRPRSPERSSPALVRPGPQFPPVGGTGRPRYALAMFADRGPRLVNLAYFGHMWELYALWTWLPAFLGRERHRHDRAASLGHPGPAGHRGLPRDRRRRAGWLPDRRLGRRPPRPRRHRRRGTGRERRMLPALTAVLHSQPPVAARLRGGVGAAVIADSGVFSTLLSELVDRRYIGTALTAQTATGFLLTIVTIQLVPLIAAGGGRYACSPGARGRAADRAARPDQPEPPDEAEPARYRHHRKDLTMNSCWPAGPPAIGQTAELSRTVTPHDIERFTQISGDRNPLHYDPAAAKASRFGEIIVQGGITSAILNAVAAESLPGPGTVFLNVNWDFKAPVRPGDVITGRVQVLEARTDKPVTKLRTTVTRGDGTVALDGTAVCYTMAITTGHPTHQSNGAPETR